ncbi:hypothetical protein ACFQY9_28495 [Microvirga aerilata]|uniref:hypothetical protein n=1 Tax=Microvirga aerilata TaxID=670292 RepID=UPI00362B801C
MVKICKRTLSFMVPSDVYDVLEAPCFQSLKRGKPFQRLMRDQEPFKPHPVMPDRHHGQDPGKPRHDPVRRELTGRVTVAFSQPDGDKLPALRRSSTNGSEIARIAATSESV